jgi:hypothetical protein
MTSSDVANTIYVTLLVGDCREMLAEYTQSSEEDEINMLKLSLGRGLHSSTFGSTQAHSV